MTAIRKNIEHILEQLPAGVRLIAVSKTHPAEKIMEAYETGIRDFGENKVQELTVKRNLLPANIRWHMIGHLQRNKVKYIVPFIHFIHSVDSEPLLAEINKEAIKCQRRIKVLLEVRIAKEETKFGLPPTEVLSLVEKNLPELYPYVEICGLMGMATFTDDENQIANEFQTIYQLFNSIQKQYPLKYPNFKELSIGMSSDFRIAVNYGSTMVRIGSSIFGERTYK
ncbi:MAG TPA: YggS family pyridoxal phosphate-dependent enzyme [Salinivirgaceae bacterium]|nr:YggS family pyridoxal phosphate-dependent enzyme [Salinivirgaceae bacterium]